MKRKLLCIAVAVIMILPLAFAAIPMASAAVSIYETSSGTPTITDYQSDNWDFQDLQGIGSANDSAAANRITPSIFNVNSETKSFGVYSNTWTAGMISSKKMFDFSSEITAEVVIGDMTHEPTAGHTVFPEQAHTIVLSAAKPYVYALGFSERNSYEGIEVRFSENASGKIDAYFNLNGGVAVYKADMFTAGDVVTFTFVNTGANIEVYAQKADEEKALIYTFVGGAALFAENAAYLAFTAQTFGGATTQPMTVNKVNGVAALDAAGTITPVVPFDPADSNWSVLTPFMADGSAPGGIVSYSSKGVIKLNSDTGNWGQAAVIYNDKLNVENLSVTINKTTNSLANELAHTGFLISAEKLTSYGLGGLSGSTYFPACNPATSLEIYVGGNGVLYGIGTVGIVAFTNTFADNVDNTLRIGKITEVEGKKYVKIYLNGEALQVMGEDEDGNPVPYDFEFNVTDIVDDNNQVYVTVEQTGYGWSGATAEFKEINGVTAGLFEGKTNYEENKAAFVDVQYRTSGDPAIRFISKVNLNNVNNNDSIEKMGTLIMPAKLLGDADLVITENGKINDISYLDIVAKNYYEKDDNFVSFTGVLTGIPENRLDREFVAVAYIIYADGTVTYGDAVTTSYNDLIA